MVQAQTLEKMVFLVLGKEMYMSKIVLLLALIIACANTAIAKEDFVTGGGLGNTARNNGGGSKEDFVSGGGLGK